MIRADAILAFEPFIVGVCWSTGVGVGVGV